MNIGILSLQGSIVEHIKAIEKLGHNPIKIKIPRHLEQVKALIIPGGESTTISKLMKEYNLDKAIVEKNKKGMPIYGTCAGSILLAKQTEDVKVNPLGLLDVSIKRNGYGRQIDSFETNLQIKNFSNPFHAIFIRAPTIDSYNSDSEVLAEFNNHPVMLRQNNILVTTFHPELTNDLRVHKYFLDMI